jgi:hypothetical protein
MERPVDRKNGFNGPGLCYWESNVPEIVVVSDKQRPVLQEITFPENFILDENDKSQFNQEYNEIIQSLEKEDLNFSKISDVELVELQVENKSAFNYCLDDLVDDLRDSSAETAPVFTELTPHIPDDRNAQMGIQTPNIREEYDQRIQGNPILESHSSAVLDSLNPNQYHSPFITEDSCPNDEIKEEDMDSKQIKFEGGNDDGATSDVSFSFRVSSFVNTNKRANAEDGSWEDDFDESEPESKSEPISSSNVKASNSALSCDVCGKTCSSSSKLKIHLATHAETPKFACEMDGCKKTFKSKIGLQEHMAKHTGQYEHFCEVCGKGFINRSYLVGHQRIHSNAKPFNCSICGQSFKSKQAMIDHKNRHLGLKPFACQAPNCDKRFTTKFLLIQHEKEHTDSTEKFACSVCSKEFNSKNYLKLHEKFHKNERKFKCEVSLQNALDLMEN